MYCSQCQGIEEVFSQEYVKRELKRYRSKGPGKTTRLLTEAIEKEGVEGLSLLDIGGGVGAIQHELIEAGVREATSVDASTAYLEAAREEADRRGQVKRVTYHQGNFVDLADEIAPADIVTLDRVICCYPDMEKLVELSAKRAKKIYGLVYPRDAWWVRAGLAIGNKFLRLQRRAFRTYSHPTKSVEAIVRRNGFRQQSYSQSLVWQVVVYTR
jgi:magnesium-protoporphyrin O-methyltransferase